MFANSIRLAHNLGSDNLLAYRLVSETLPALHLRWLQIKLGNLSRLQGNVPASGRQAPPAYAFWDPPFPKPTRDSQDIIFEQLRPFDV